MEEKIDEVILEIEGSSFYAALDFIDNHFVGYSIEYNKDGENFIINGANVGMGIDRYYYIDENDKEQTREMIDFETPKDKDLLAKFNETTMKRYEEKIAKRQISENEAKQLLLELLDYIDKVTKEGAISLTKKVRSLVESVKVEFRRPEEVLEIIKKT